MLIMIMVLMVMVHGDDVKGEQTLKLLLRSLGPNHQRQVLGRLHKQIKEAQASLRRAATLVRVTASGIWGRVLMVRYRECRTKRFRD